MLTKIEWLFFSILIAYGVIMLCQAGRFLIGSYLINRRERKKKKVLNIHSADFIDALGWSKEDDAELREMLESGGYPKELIKKVFDKKDLRALNKLIKIADERIKKRKNERRLEEKRNRGHREEVLSRQTGRGSKKNKC